MPNKISRSKSSRADLVLKNLVEAFYRQKPLPPTAVVFKMNIIEAIKYLKNKGYELPHYDMVRTKFLKEQRAKKTSGG